MVDLTRALAPGSDERLLAVVRLHGLHDLRERRGLAAEDQLLTVRRSFELEVGSSGRVYLTRWDELCVLLKFPLETAIQLLDHTTEVLNQLISASGVEAEAGVALLPEEAADPISALERADRRINPASYSGRQSGVIARRERRMLEQEILLASQSGVETGA